MLNFAAIVPHQPVLIPSIGQSQTGLFKKTIDALDKLSLELKSFKPHTIAIISPHGPMRYDKFTVNLEDNFRGSFASFGSYDEPDVNFLSNSILSKTLFERLRKKNFPVEVIREGALDYGTLVPLSYLIKPLEKKPKIITLTFTAFDWEMHYQFGKAVGQVLEEVEQNVAFIASADLSQRISENSPAGFSPYGSKFDKTILELLKDNDTARILNLNPDFCVEAGECGLRSILVALGAVSGMNYTFEQLSYESPLGIGHLVGRWKLK